MNDVGVVLLDEPIHVDVYPEIATEPVEHGAWATLVGRTKHGRASSDWLFASPPTVLLQDWPLWPEAMPLYYTAPERRIESGDSGGPVYAHDPDADDQAPRTLVGVVAHTYGVYRVEHLHDWITSFTDEG